MALGIGQVLSILKEVKINRELLPMETVWMSYSAFGGTVCMAQANSIAVVVRKVDQPWEHRSKNLLLFS